MTIRIGINGLGRIGRCVLRALVESDRNDIELVAVNGPAPIETHVHLLKYDSVHGGFRGEVKADGEDLLINGKRVKLTHEREPENIGWDVDYVLECTGIFKSVEQCNRHMSSKVKGVLVSAPSPDAHSTIVYGVNNEALKAEHTVVSVGSCTTNCLAPVAKVLNDEFGIVNGFMTTVHAYTGDQNIVDATHKDLRRARAAAVSMIPTSTGAAKAISLVIPELEGKLDGVAVRVPTPNVSLVDLTFNSEKPMTIEAINAAVKAASSDVLAYTDEPLVSIDFNHHPASSIFDATGTRLSGDKMGRIAAWYDNEWGFSNRMLDVTALMAKVHG
ncbi:MAG: type I glyceraldehyde-3-phosphate dehydrogenase [Rickettsiales bacterium]|nr:type I glyceraldehyde-3-phosphate dehydrogenase [Rickettsiales bacterium]